MSSSFINYPSKTLFFLRKIIYAGNSMLMIRKTLVVVICLIPFFCEAQHDVLVLQRRGMHEQAFTIGDPMSFETVYGQWFNGTIEDLHHDTVYIAGQAFNYHEI